MAVGYVSAYAYLYLPLCTRMATEILCDSNRSLFESIVRLGRPTNIGVNAKKGESGNYYYRRAHTHTHTHTSLLRKSSNISLTCMFA